MAAAINQACIQVDLVYAKLQNAEALAAHLQGQLGLKLPWEVGGEEYMHYKEEATLSKYHEALDEVECLVIMHLFELSKLRMSQTGNKSLQWRSKAIQKAIAWYSIQAAVLNPSQSPISWKDITHYTLLGEFNLLWHTKDDV
ncbi:hypothetical protein J3A83DRAFT_4374896 [Scleroderma citrinum]